MAERWGWVPLVALVIVVFARTVGFGFFNDDYFLARPWTIRAGAQHLPRPVRPAGLRPEVLPSDGLAVVRDGVARVGHESLGLSPHQHRHPLRRRRHPVVGAATVACRSGGRRWPERPTSRWSRPTWPPSSTSLNGRTRWWRSASAGSCGASSASPNRAPPSGWCGPVASYVLALLTKEVATGAVPVRRGVLALPPRRTARTVRHRAGASAAWSRTG